MTQILLKQKEIKEIRAFWMSWININSFLEKNAIFTIILMEENNLVLGKNNKA